MSANPATEDAGSLSSWIRAGRHEYDEFHTDAVPDSIESLRAQNEEARGKIKKVIQLQRY